MKQLTESENFFITYEYEKAFLNFKNSNRSVLIGEFYGDPDIAIISKDEDFCAVGGEGIIVYYLNEPFSEYESNESLSKQWLEWGRDNEDSVIWIEKLEQIGNKMIEITTEESDKFIINV